MSRLRVHDLVRKRALITRDSAEIIKTALAQASADEELVLDFSGIDAVTPSFVDETLAAVGDRLRESQKPLCLVFLHPPTRLSSKFAAVGRARELEITEAADGSWVVTRALADEVQGTRPP